MTHDPNPDGDFSLTTDGNVDPAKATALAIILDSSALALEELLKETGFDIKALALLVKTGDDMAGGVGMPHNEPTQIAELCMRHAQALVEAYDLKPAGGTDATT